MKSVIYIIYIRRKQKSNYETVRGKEAPYPAEKHRQAPSGALQKPRQVCSSRHPGTQYMLWQAVSGRQNRYSRYLIGTQ